MRTFVGMFLALSLVSGDEEVMTISGDLKDSVLLPCPCLHRNLDKELRWQKDEPHPTISVVKCHKNHSIEVDDTYRDRVSVFLHENSSNCSVLLANITTKDQGKYRCSFYKEERHSKKFVYLNITARYRVCLTNDSDLRFFQCNASGWHRDAVIEWKSDGQLLTDSAKTRIIHSNTREAPSGLYHIISELNTKFKLSSTPTCDIKAIGLPTVVTNECPPQYNNRNSTYTAIIKDPETKSYRYIKIIPFVLALVFFLVLWRRWKVSQG